MAQLRLDSVMNFLKDLNFFRFSNFGKDFIKRQNMSPDAFIQLGNGLN